MTLSLKRHKTQNYHKVTFPCFLPWKTWWCQSIDYSRISNQVLRKFDTRKSVVWLHIYLLNHWNHFSNISHSQRERKWPGKIWARARRYDSEDSDAVAYVLADFQPSISSMLVNRDSLRWNHVRCFLRACHMESFWYRLRVKLKEMGFFPIKFHKIVLQYTKRY